MVRLCVLSFVALLLTGCKTSNYTAAHRGIYTIVYNPTNLPIENIDLDALRAKVKTSFGPDEQPAVVIVDYPEERKLKLLNRDTGKIVDTKRAFFGTVFSVAIQPVDIRQTGNYEIYFHEAFEPRVAFDFSVTRTPGKGVQTNKITPRPLGLPFVSLSLGRGSAFKNYDLLFLTAVQQQWYKLLDNSPPPSSRGLVILQFNLTEQGQITGMKVTKNTVDRQSAAICTQAILNLAPFRPWPAEMRKKVAKDYRSIHFTFRYD